jgi:hypothetical protein
MVGNVSRWGIGLFHDDEYSTIYIEQYGPYKQTFQGESLFLGGQRGLRGLSHLFVGLSWMCCSAINPSHSFFFYFVRRDVPE